MHKSLLSHALNRIVPASRPHRGRSRGRTVVNPAVLGALGWSLLVLVAPMATALGDDYDGHPDPYHCEGSLEYSSTEHWKCNNEDAVWVDGDSTYKFQVCSGTGGTCPINRCLIKCEDGYVYCVKYDEGEFEMEKVFDENDQAVRVPADPPAGTNTQNTAETQAKAGGRTFRLSRFSSSSHDFTGSGLGPQWDSSIQPRVEDNGSDGAVVYFGHTRPIQVDITNGSYEKQRGFELKKVNSKFEVQWDSGATLYFNSSNNAISKTFPDGDEYHWSYDANQNVQTVEMRYDDGGNQTTKDLYTAQYDAATDRITKITNARINESVTYSYNTNNQLTSADSTCSSCSGTAGPRGYTYVAGGDGQTRVEKVTDGNGNQLEKTVYDNEGRVITRYKGDSSTYQYMSYEQVGNGIYIASNYSGDENWRYLDANGYVTKTKRHSNGNDYSILEKYVDANGNITRQRWATDVSGGTTKWQTEDFKFNGSNQATMRIAYDYGVTNPITKVQKQYDGNGRVTWETNARGLTKTRAYDSSGNMTHVAVKHGGQQLADQHWVYNGSGQAITYVNQGDVTRATSYNSNGHVTKRVTDPGGLAITREFYPDANGRVTKRVGPRGNATLTAYNSGGQVTRREVPSGRVQTSTYDLQGRLVTKQVFDSGGNVTRTWSYAYDKYGQRTQKTDPAGNKTEFKFDADGRITHSIYPDGRETKKVYGPQGIEHRLVYDGGSTWITKQTVYRDHMGRVTKRENALGHATLADRDWDGYGRLTRQEGPLGNYTTYAYNDEDQRTQVIKYDHNSGGSDLAKRERRMSYDIRGRVTARRQLASPGGSTSSADRLTEMSHDAMGRVTERTRHLDGSTTAISTTTYDDAGRAITREPAGRAATVMHYDDGGNVVSRVQDPTGLGLVTEHQYDNMGRRVTTERPDDTHVVRKYDGLGQVTLTQRFPGEPSTTSAFAARGKHYHDQLGLVTRTFQIADPGSRTSFDSATDPSQVNLYAYSQGGELTARKDASGHKTEFTYDAQGRRVTTTDPAGNERIVVYDDAGRAITRIRDNSASGGDTFKVALEYDKLGRTTKTIRQGPDGDISASTDNLATTQSYDALGRITQSTDPAGMKMVRHYDALGQVTRQEENPNGVGRVTDRDYNRGGRLIKLTAYTHDPSSANAVTQETDYQYNLAGAKTRVIYPDDTSHAGSDRGDVTFAYDDVMRMVTKEDQKANQTVTEYDKMGRKTKVTRGSKINTFLYKPSGQLSVAKRGVSGNLDDISKVTRSYNGLQRMTSETQHIEQDTGRTVNYSYDLAGNVTETDYPGDTRIETTFTSLDQRNVLTKHDDGANTSEQIADYDYHGPRVDKLTFETGSTDVVQDHEYDGAARLTRLNQKKGSTKLATFSYSFDDAGNVLDKTFEHRSDDVEDYDYDTLHRLTKTTFGQRDQDPYKEWVYDHLGNHLTQDDDGTTIEGEFNAVNEQTKRSSSGLTWDKTGNLTEDDGGQQYAYDRQNMLTRVEDASDNLLEEYKYDALGRRIIADDGTNEKRFYYTGQQIIEETDGSNVVQRSYVWGNYIDELLLYDNESSGNEYFALRHHNYNVVALTDDTGSVVERYDYNPYGKRLVLDADYSDDTDGQSDANLFIGHQGLYHDTTTGLIYNRARMLHTKLRRFMQRDPLGYVDGSSLYQYEHSNPVIHYDIFGRNAKGRGVINGRIMTICIAPDCSYVTDDGNISPEFGKHKMLQLTGLLQVLQSCQDDFDKPGVTVKPLTPKGPEGACPCPEGDNDDWNFPTGDAGEKGENELRQLREYMDNFQDQVSSQTDRECDATVVLTRLTIDAKPQGEDLAGYGGVGNGAIIKGGSNDLTLAHEIGHIVNYRGAPWRHSKVNENNIMNDGMLVANADKEWCDKVYKQLTDSIREEYPEMFGDEE